MRNKMRSRLVRIVLGLLTALLLVLWLNLDLARRMVLIVVDVGYAMSTGTLEASFKPSLSRSRLCSPTCPSPPMFRRFQALCTKWSYSRRAVRRCGRI